jgi:hypothetical protein
VGGFKTQAEFAAQAMGALTKAQFADYKATLAVTGAYHLAEEELVKAGAATADQAALLTLHAKSTVVLSSAENELAGIRKKAVADQLGAGEQATKDALARGLVIRQAISAAEKKRKAEADANKAESQGNKDREKALADEARALDNRTKNRLKRIADLAEYQREISLSMLKDLFESGAILEEEYLDRSKTAAIESARETQKESLRILKYGRLERGLNAAEENAEIAALNRSLQSDIQAASVETAQVVREKREGEIADVGVMVGAIGGMFATMSGLARQAYEDGDAEAKKHAIAMFHVSQGAALATATINMALAISGALANFPAPPYSIPQAIAAGVMGATQIATIVGTSIQGIGDAGITTDMLKSAGLNNHSAIVMRNDETLLDPVGTKHITEMLAMQKSQMQGGGGDQTIRTTVEIDGRVLGESVDNYMIRQQERGLAYGNRVRQEYV